MMNDNSLKQLTAAEGVKEFLNLLRIIQTNYNIMLSVEDEQNKLTQDILHKLELNDLSYKERAKLATLLARNRKNRRVAKDAREEMEPLINFLKEPGVSKTIARLQQLLGELRKVEHKHTNRFYVPRTTIMTEESGK